MYKENRGLVEWHLDDTFNDIFIERCEKFEINPKDVKFYSQQDEDKYIIQYILKEKIDDGVFLELGSCDGILYSNTKTLEDHFGFNGILIEPIKHFYDKLVNNRPKCEKYNFAISNSDNKYVKFHGNNAEGGILDFHENRNGDYIEVANKKMSDLLLESKYRHIDIFILDVEGSELDVLKSINFDEIDIYCIIVEAMSTHQEQNKIVGEYLKSNGFIYKERQRGNEIWFNESSERKKLFQ